MDSFNNQTLFNQTSCIFPLISNEGRIRPAPDEEKKKRKEKDAPLLPTLPPVCFPVKAINSLAMFA